METSLCVFLCVFVFLEAVVLSWRPFATQPLAAGPGVSSAVSVWPSRPSPSVTTPRQEGLAPLSSPGRQRAEGDPPWVLVFPWVLVYRWILVPPPWPFFFRGSSVFLFCL